MKKIICTTLSAAILLNVTACGTLLYPERKGQPKGGMADINAQVAMLDSLAILFFIIPGVVAYAVDYSNGTLFLPPNQRERSDIDMDIDEMIALKFEKESLTNEKIAAVIFDKTGKKISHDIRNGKKLVN